MKRKAREYGGSIAMDSRAKVFKCESGVSFSSVESCEKLNSEKIDCNIDKSEKIQDDIVYTLHPTMSSSFEDREMSNITKELKNVNLESADAICAAEDSLREGEFLRDQLKTFGDALQKKFGQPRNVPSSALEEVYERTFYISKDSTINAEQMADLEMIKKYGRHLDFVTATAMLQAHDLNVDQVMIFKMTEYNENRFRIVPVIESGYNHRPMRWICDYKYLRNLIEDLDEVKMVTVSSLKSIVQVRYRDSDANDIGVYTKKRLGSESNYYS